MRQLVWQAQITLDDHSWSGCSGCNKCRPAEPPELPCASWCEKKKRSWKKKCKWAKCSGCGSCSK